MFLARCRVRVRVRARVRVRVGVWVRAKARTKVIWVRIMDRVRASIRLVLGLASGQG